jgi:hypothetical protein
MGKKTGEGESGIGENKERTVHFPLISGVAWVIF